MKIIQGVNVKWNRTEIRKPWGRGRKSIIVATVDVLIDGGLSVIATDLGKDQGAAVTVVGPDGSPVGSGIVCLSVLIGSAIKPIGGRKKYRVAHGSKAIPSLVFIDTVLPAGYVGNSVTAVTTLTAWPKDGIEIEFPVDSESRNGGVTPPGNPEEK